MSNATSLKAKIRNLAKQKNIPAQVLLQNYMFEHRYAIHVQGKTSFLFFERNASIAGNNIGRWFVERR